MSKTKITNLSPQSKRGISIDISILNRGILLSFLIKQYSAPQNLGQSYKTFTCMNIAHTDAICANNTKSTVRYDALSIGQLNKVRYVLDDLTLRVCHAGNRIINL
ncbi:MAG TPA: hypothetical protein VJU85_01915 [Nitrososphaeraceae archaeon]|nr:hypothetical protein [Nitrososphaeraceae archaeon]